MRPEAFFARFSSSSTAAAAAAASPRFFVVVELFQFQLAPWLRLQMI